jgi:hypothetical protein
MVDDDQKRDEGTRAVERDDTSRRRGLISFEDLAPHLCMPLALGISSRTSQCFGRINMRSFLGPLLVVVGKGLELTGNRSVSHGLRSAEQSLCCFQVFVASL